MTANVERIPAEELMALLYEGVIQRGTYRYLQVDTYRLDVVDGMLLADVRTRDYKVRGDMFTVDKTVYSEYESCRWLGVYVVAVRRRGTPRCFRPDARNLGVFLRSNDEWVVGIDPRPPAADEKTPVLESGEVVANVYLGGCPSLYTPETIRYWNCRMEDLTANGREAVQYIHDLVGDTADVYLVTTYSD